VFGVGGIDLYDTDDGTELGLASIASNSNGTDHDLLFEEYDCLSGRTNLDEIDQINTV
jgi:hypothetical protein